MSLTENRLSTHTKEPQIAVSKAIFPDYQKYFDNETQHKGRDWRVTDPDGVWIFAADGNVSDSTKS